MSLDGLFELRVGSDSLSKAIPVPGTSIYSVLPAFTYFLRATPDPLWDQYNCWFKEIVCNKLLPDGVYHPPEENIPHQLVIDTSRKLILYTTGDELPAAAVEALRSYDYQFLVFEILK